MKTQISRALSLRQPFVEQILRGVKKKELRSKPTHIRERVYLYASLKPAPDDRWEGTPWEPGALPTGLLLGSVEITNCVWDARRKLYAYSLARPRRLRKPIRPANQVVAGAWFWRPRFPGSPNGSRYLRARPS